MFTLPSVEVGSILEYSYQLRYDDDHVSEPWWELQYPYFVNKEHYSFTPHKSFLKGSMNATSHYVMDSHGNPVSNLIWWTQLPEGAKLVDDATGHFSIDLTDIPAIPDEDYMPPIRAFLYHIFFYYVPPITRAISGKVKPSAGRRKWITSPSLPSRSKRRLPS